MAVVTLARGREEISPTTAIGVIDRIRRAVSDAEAKQPEKTKMELVLQLQGRGENITSRIAEGLTRPANAALKFLHRVDPWPENEDIVFQEGTTVRIRWFRNPAWASVIWSVLTPLLIGLVAVAVIVAVIWLVNKYVPGAKPMTWGIVAGIGLILFGPIIVRLIRNWQESYYG